MLAFVVIVVMALGFVVILSQKKPRQPVVVVEVDKFLKELKRAEARRKFEGGELTREEEDEFIYEALGILAAEDDVF